VRLLCAFAVVFAAAGLMAYGPLMEEA